MGVASIFRINDATVVVDLDADGIGVVEPIDTWMKPGDNSLDVELRWPGGQDFVAGRADVEAELFLADSTSDSPRPGRVLARVQWPPPGHLDQEDHYPLHLQYHFEISPPPPTRLWQEAERITQLGQLDRTQIFQRVADLRRALMTQQPNQAYDLLAYRYAEEARAEGKTEGQIRAAVLEGYSKMYSFGHLDFEPVDEQSLILRPHADRQVVHVMREGYQFAFIATHTPSDTCFGIPVFMARVRGEWIIVR